MDSGAKEGVVSGQRKGRQMKPKIYRGWRIDPREAAEVTGLSLRFLTTRFSIKTCPRPSGPLPADTEKLCVNGWRRKTKRPLKPMINEPIPNRYQVQNTDLRRAHHYICNALGFGNTGFL